MFGECDPELVYEDMQVMSDFELHLLCKKSKPLRKFMLDEKEAIAEGGKIPTLVDLIAAAHKNVSPFIKGMRSTSCSKKDWQTG